MIKIVKSWDVQGKYTAGTDGGGNLFLKHLEGCNTTMSCTDRDFKNRTWKFVCPKCGRRKLIR